MPILEWKEFGHIDDLTSYICVEGVRGLVEHEQGLVEKVKLLDEHVDGLIETTHGPVEQVHMLNEKVQGCVEQMQGLAEKTYGPWRTPKSRGEPTWGFTKV
jgi:hypothetical protein